MRLLVLLFPVFVACSSASRGPDTNSNQDPNPNVPASAPSTTPATNPPSPPTDHPSPTQSAPVIAEPKAPVQKPSVPDTVTFAKVSSMFVKPAYGPCSSCHSGGNWPTLNSAENQGWEKFLASATLHKHGVSTPHELGALILDCVDQTSRAHCAAAPNTQEDNTEFKMPTKFGFEPVSQADINILKQWLQAN